jgi:asparagine synthase (glutamine-hydrolysing)
MCGIAGFISKVNESERFATLLPRLQQAIAHRGPDDRGIHVSSDGRAGLVNTRLAILDLSAAGHQPMLTADGRYAIVYNGEIYNFRALADSLVARGVALRSHSDTEVILALYRLLGVECVRELRGMFAFAIWDDVEKICFLARDPLGIKPLYYHAKPDGPLAFASELRALRDSGLTGNKLDPEALAAYFRQGSVPEPLTLLRGVRTLEAGHWLRWRDGRCETQSFWTLPIGGLQESIDPLTEKEDSSAVRAALLDSLEHHFVSDVPVGLFLSGGIDSTALLALARLQGHDALSTYSLSFDDAVFNEGELARRSAEQFGSKHIDHRLSGPTGKQLFADFLNRLDQPSVDGFNTFAISQVAREHGAKVVLSGLGGDELFGGYPSFERAPAMLQSGRFPAPLRQLAGTVLTRWPGHPRVRRLGEYLTGDPTLDAAMGAIRGIFSRAEANSLVKHFIPDAVTSSASDISLAQELPADSRDAVSAHELSHYMRNQLLRDSDVASMAWGLELRVPLVDARLIETLARIPSERRLRPNKAMLVEAVPEIPEWIARAPKRGFTLPFEQWLREDWSDLFADPAHSLAGVRANHWYQRWTILVFQHWLER